MRGALNQVGGDWGDTFSPIGENPGFADVNPLVRLTYQLFISLHHVNQCNS